MSEQPISAADAFALSVKQRVATIQSSERAPFGDPALVMAGRLTATDFIYANAGVSYAGSKTKALSANIMVAVELATLAVSLVRGADMSEVLAQAHKTLDNATRYAGVASLGASPPSPPTVEDHLPQTEVSGEAAKVVADA